jgi:D-serine dehydratase
MAIVDALSYDPPVQPHHKGFPAAALGQAVSQLRGMTLRAAAATGGLHFSTPVLLLREQALADNVRVMQDYCDRAGVSLAPHVKTTLSPEIISRQLAAGAWAVTVATPTQLRTLRWLGAPRVVLANQLVDPAAIEWLGTELDRDPRFEAYCYVDSVVGVNLLAHTLAGRGQRRPLPVLVELGMRTGARTVDEVTALARQVAESPQLRLAGVGGFEGVIEVGQDPQQLVQVERYLYQLREAADQLAGGMAGDVPTELIVTVGGSAYFELVPTVFDARWRAGRPVRVLLRSGCYVTHDSAAYQQFRSVMAHRCQPLALTAALELWARVLSRPESGLALLDFGKRDTGTDAGFPVPQHVIRRGGAVGPPPLGSVVALNDQHAYLRAMPPATRLDLAVGDLVGFGVSHPCTTFDKWRLIPVVDDHRALTAAVRTLF